MAGSSFGEYLADHISGFGGSPLADVRLPGRSIFVDEVFCNPVPAAVSVPSHEIVALG